MKNEYRGNTEDQRKLEYISRNKGCIEQSYDWDDEVIWNGCDYREYRGIDDTQPQAGIIDEFEFVYGVEEQHRIDRRSEYIDGIFSERRKNIHERTDKHDENTDQGRQ